LTIAESGFAMGVYAIPALAAETKPRANAPLRIIVLTMGIFLPGFQIAACLHSTTPDSCNLRNERWLNGEHTKKT
jgi:hypothetical protein